MPVGSSGRRRQPWGMAATTARRSASASAVGERSRITSAPTVIRSVASWPTRHMIDFDRAQLVTHRRRLPSASLVEIAPSRNPTSIVAERRGVGTIPLG